MIPRRVKLEGFLCYKDAQEIRFEENKLWMLSGLNGSGKSSVFDAVTFGLFGQHRGGSQDAHELINKDSDRAVVEFDFSQDNKVYRAYRTIQRTKKGGAKTTQQLFEVHSAGEAKPIEGTSQRDGFKNWIEQNIGLNFETFTSSVLLLQGKAEKLLDSTAKGRFEVLAGIVDLDRYERLHRKSEESRKRQEVEVEKIQYKLASLPAVEESVLTGAEERIKTAEEAWQQAEAVVERLRDLLTQSHQWADLQDRLKAVTGRLDQAQSLFTEADAIERDASRLAELNSVIPRLKAIGEEQRRIEESDGVTKKLTEQKEKLNAQLLQQDDAREQTRRKGAVLQQYIDKDEARSREVNVEFREVHGQLQKLQEYEQQETELGKIQHEVSRLREDPAALVAQVREAQEKLVALERVVPVLSRFHNRREELRDAREREQKTTKKLADVKSRGEQVSAEVKRLKPQLEEAQQQLRAAADQLAEARTIHQQAQKSLEELSALTGSKVCRHCGQALTAGHVEDEKKRRKKEVTAAKKALDAAQEAHQTASGREEKLRKQSQELEQKLQAARDEYKDCKAEMEHAQKDAERLRVECGETHSELAEPFRSRVSVEKPDDWLTTTFPAADDIAELRREVASLPEAKRRVQEAEQMQRRWHDLKTKEATVRQALGRLEKQLPRDRDSVRQLHARLEAEEKTLQESLKARRAEKVAVQKDLDRLGDERDKTKKKIADLDAKLAAEEKTRLHCQQTIDREHRELPPAWKKASERIGLTELNGWLTERDHLVGKGTERREKELRQARVSLEAWRQERVELEQKLEAIPPEARAMPDVLQAQQQTARLNLRNCEKELAEARHAKENLEQSRIKRQELQQEYLKADRELNHAQLLAGLLGRDRLQLHLVRQAERQVVDHANAVLDRLSSGQLYLRLCGEADGDGNTAKALELECYNRETGEKPINVAFLSGSQKFRVAVALAMGIGQYASRQHRPIESVIIDEGFGCLDREGRQVMIRELHNLRGHLHCILLVSHQEEFAEAFSDGYKFRLVNGATQVEPLRR